MEFSRQEYWSGLPCPPPGDLPDPGIELGSPALQVDSLAAELPGKPQTCIYVPGYTMDAQNMYMYICIDSVNLTRSQGAKVLGKY